MESYNNEFVSCVNDGENLIISKRIVESNYEFSFKPYHNYCLKKVDLIFDDEPNENIISTRLLNNNINFSIITSSQAYLNTSFSYGKYALFVNDKTINLYNFENKSMPCNELLVLLVCKPKLDKILRWGNVSFKLYLEPIALEDKISDTSTFYNVDITQFHIFKKLIGMVVKPENISDKICISVGGRKIEYCFNYPEDFIRFTNNGHEIDVLIFDEKFRSKNETQKIFNYNFDVYDEIFHFCGNTQIISMYDVSTNLDFEFLTMEKRPL